MGALFVLWGLIMYNSFLKYLLKNSPDETLSKIGSKVRKCLNPVIRFAIPFTTKTKLKILRRAKMPAGPIVFCSTHGFKEDIVDAVVIAKKPTYILIGSLSQIFRHFDGVTSWLNGVILVNRSDKESRVASKAKMKRAIELGSSILMFPEGTWNKSPNELTSGLFSGFYDVAKATNTPVALIATHREGKYVYGILDEAFDVSNLTKEEAAEFLKERMATLRYEMLETYSKDKRENLPFGKDAQYYWKKYIDDLMAEVEFYDYEEELHTKFVDKKITTYGMAFKHLNDIKPTMQNAFLFNKRLK